MAVWVGTCAKGAGDRSGLAVIEVDRPSSARQKQLTAPEPELFPIPDDAIWEIRCLCGLSSSMSGSCVVHSVLSVGSRTSGS